MQAALARHLALDALTRYWTRDLGPIEALAQPSPPWPAEEHLPPILIHVQLPEWAADLGVDGRIPVPAHRVDSGMDDPFLRTDWLGAAFWYIHGCAERAFEAAHGPIHSYSFRLKGWNADIWQRAWANRIALLLRRWSARHSGMSEDMLFGPLPKAEILLTHDIDALSMTWSLRCKQAAFHGFNAIRQLLRGRPASAKAKLSAALRFAATHGDLWHVDEVATLERARQLTGHFFVYGRGGRRSLKLALVDPQYDIARTRLANALRPLVQGGFRVGLHQSYDSWRDADAMKEEKRRVEHYAGITLQTCRQHWLRFSWEHTWEAQERAGFTLDATLGFNDRPGFRNGAALRFRPYSEARAAPLSIESVPMMLMDSQLYDYAELDDSARIKEMERWLGEVRYTGGVASVIWHPHTLGPEYGWRPGFEALLDRVSEYPQ